jgi:hypothetical protein
VLEMKAVYGPPSSESETVYEAMLEAPGPGVPLQLTVKFGLEEMFGSEFTLLVGNQARYVLAWGEVGVG